MLFSSYEFIFLFLPITFFVYFYLNSKRLTQASKAFLVLASLFFYSWWNMTYLPLILVSMLFNYVVGNSLSKNIKENTSRLHKTFSKKQILVFGIIVNLSLLGYFKYADFFISNFNFVTNSNVGLLYLLLPLAISFFTFQQIAYLVDSYRGETKEYDFLNYALFVTFFPQLIAGPIVHHKEMMPQFASKWNMVKNYKNIATGLFIFSIGLFKKVAIADTFAVWTTAGFDTAKTLNLIEAWATSLSYTFQLYFDFSGYCDMAIGIALLFNIKLPINFNSPYKALSIQDFWRRWHMTLSRFLRDYIYIPLGGNRKGEIRTYINLLATFLIGGLWHGAGWTFVIWGGVHGVALAVHRLWQNLGFKMNKILAWFITFNFVNIAWVFFRAKDFESAMKVLKGMFLFEDIRFSIDFLDKISMWTNIPLYQYLPYVTTKANLSEMSLIVCLIFVPLVLILNNINEYSLGKQNITTKLMFVGALVFAYSIVSSFFTSTQVFLYFNF
ncbi:MBOAT family protein [Campylobacter sp. RM13119]|uniref:MBOAT family O-acyltransferase n=1 Tax=Campylobacter californiensis TaxID=1032243 RepID=UPI001473F0EE|nr:MBOAT family protein [Campylobacter sp. RM13119]MBE3606439.1 MBOAT family protein [Campylobacter sp. RM13119]